MATSRINLHSVKKRRGPVNGRARPSFARSGPERSSAKRTRLSPDERRAQLLRVASEIVTQRGIDALQFTELASAAGVTRPVVYRFFPSRSALIVGLLEDFEVELTARFVRAGSDTSLSSVEDFARVFIDAVCDTIESKGAGAWHLLDSKGPDPEAARIGREIQARMVGPWLAHIAEATGAPRREVQAVAHMIVAAGRAVLELWYFGELSRKEAARDATRGVSALLGAFTVESPRSKRARRR